MQAIWSARKRQAKKMHSVCPLKTLQNFRDGILASELTPQKVQQFFENTLKRAN